MWLLAHFLVALSFFEPARAIAGDCLRFADHQIINAHFSNGGPGTKVYLCPGTEYPLGGTIVFTAADQELATLGYPSGDQMARLRIDSERVATAIQGDCRRCARVAVRNLIIDGARKVLGRVRDANNSPGLIILGGNVGQTVRECAITDPRGFTAIHVREGAKLNCRGVVIERNEISSVGEEYDKAYDGPDPEASPWGRPLADGISIACRDSVVRDNFLTDCTDAGIVVYCSPGSRIENNRVETLHRSAIGGILLVDSAPFDGDYTGVVVKDNVLDARSRAMRVGIGVGLSVLSDDIETILKGGSVISNTLMGDYLGYGIAAAGLADWTIIDNLDQGRYEGEPSDRCFDEPVNPHPQAFIYNSATLEKSTIQDGFYDSDFAYIVCIDGVGEAPVRYQAVPGKAVKAEPVVPGSGHGGVSTPGEGAPLKRMAHKKQGGKNKDVPVAPEVPNVEAEPEEATEDAVAGGLQSTGSKVLDGILMHSQQRILDRIDEITSSVRLSMLRPSPAQDVVPRLNAQGDAFPALNARLNDLELSQAKLLTATRDLQAALFMLRGQVQDVGLWEGDVLLSIKQEVEGRAWAAASKQPNPSEDDDGNDDDDDDDDDEVYEASYSEHEFVDSYDAGPIDWLVKLILLGGFCSAIALCFKRYRRQSLRDKLV